MDIRLLNSSEQPKTLPDCTAETQKNTRKFIQRKPFFQLEHMQNQDTRKRLSSSRICARSDQNKTNRVGACVCVCVCACTRERSPVLTQPLGLVDVLGRASHEQLVQSSLGGFVRFGWRPETMRVVTPNISTGSDQCYVAQAQQGCGLRSKSPNPENMR